MMHSFARSSNDLLYYTGVVARVRGSRCCCSAVFAGRHFASQTRKRSLNSDETAVVTRIIAVRGPLATYEVAPAPVAIGLKRHYPARGRVSAGWRPRSGFNNAVPSMAGSLEVVRLGLDWGPLMGRRLGPSANEQRASLCARARARCQWRQLATNYTGRLLPIADVGHP